MKDDRTGGLITAKLRDADTTMGRLCLCRGGISVGYHAWNASVPRITPDDIPREL
jgi:hypothetical protein